MIAMNQIKHIKSLSFEQGMNLSEISKKMNIDWKTVKKYVEMEAFNVELPTLKARQKGVDMPYPKLYEVIKNA